MNFPYSSQMNWYAKRAVRTAGWPGVVAMLLLACCAGAWFLVLKPTKSRIETLQHETRSLRSQSRVNTPVGPKVPNPSEQLDLFYKYFPSKSTAPDWMAKLYSAAAQQNLMLEHGDYRLTHEKDGKLWRYGIVLPVKGPYIQVRKFIAQVQGEIPHLALDGITFSRQKINDPVVDVQLQFTLYLGES